MNHQKQIALFSLLSLALCAAAPLLRAESEVHLEIPSLEVTHHSDLRIYGHFLEHIFHSVNGGLWGQVVWNCSFEQEETLPKELPGKMTKEEWLRLHPVKFWEKSTNGAIVTSDASDAVNGKKSLFLKTSPAGESAEIYQANVRIQKDDPFDGSLWIKGKLGEGRGLIIQLESTNSPVQAVGASTPDQHREILASSTILPDDDTAWKEYPIHLQPSGSCDHGILRVILPASEAGLLTEVKLDQLTLMPSSAQATGGFRPDLLEALKALHPAFIRWPGGDFVFGFHWKESVGPVVKRGNKGGWGDLDPLGMGLDEYMKLCKLVGAEPLLVVDIDVNRPDLIKQATEMLEYCNGSDQSPMGKLRAANGHPAPYKVKLWEVGNEMWRVKPEDYLAECLKTVREMKKIDPTIQVIASGGGQLGTHRNTGLLDAAVIKGSENLIDYLSVHHYEDPEKFATGPDAAKAYWNKLGTMIKDSSNPKMKLFMSEWNAQCIDWRGGLYAAGLLNEMERSSSLAMASPALLMRHLSTGKAWDNAFINFDCSGLFEAPNYLVMKLWRENYAPNMLALQGESNGLNVLPTLTDDGKTIILKIVNPQPDSRKVSINLPRDFSFHSTSATWISSTDLRAANSLANPNQIQSTTGVVERDGQALQFLVPAYGVGVVRASTASSQE